MRTTRNRCLGRKRNPRAKRVVSTTVQGVLEASNNAVLEDVAEAEAPEPWAIPIGQEAAMKRREATTKSTPALEAAKRATPAHPTNLTGVLVDSTSLPNRMLTKFELISVFYAFINGGYFTGHGPQLLMKLIFPLLLDHPQVWSLAI
jgi:hypothetical protein